MHNIWTIFKNDLRSLGKCFFACVVAVAIVLLPSLYAWLNIYSNWDPYGNTGGISIAVASLDEGYTDENGCYENKGDAVVEDLRNATSINWVIVDTEQEAKQGVEAGDYYAAVVIDRQFTRNMYRMLTDWTGKPAITYYENAKKNAVATKITDTAVETLKRSISENYLEVVISSIMEQSNLLAADLNADAKALKAALKQTGDAAGTAMGLLRPAAEKLLSSLEETLEGLQEYTDEQFRGTLLEILGGDPLVYGQYFPEMVQTRIHTVYPVANYGSAMTPFYTVLSIWVGGVILSSIVKVHARTEGLIDPKPAELFFGRYLFFFVISQIQSIVIVSGDLYLLKVQCLHPGMMYLTGALTAFTFSLLIYSLAISFGDVGMALSVIIMVIQVAGSGGSYPVDVLPQLFRSLYPFMPFHYGMDMIRETVGGMYGSTYLRCALVLLGMCVLFTVLGLLLYYPARRLNAAIAASKERSGIM